MEVEGPAGRLRWGGRWLCDLFVLLELQRAQVLVNQGDCVGDDLGSPLPFVFCLRVLLLDVAQL